MRLRFEIYCIGYKVPNSQHMLWGAVLVAHAPDGREKKSVKIGILQDGINKSLADVLAVTKTLQCLKPEHRSADITIFAPPGYANQMMERKPDGSWSLTPQSNVAEVAAVRTMVSKYTRLEIRKIDRAMKLFQELIEALRKQVIDAGMATS